MRPAGALVTGHRFEQLRGKQAENHFPSHSGGIKGDAEHYHRTGEADVRGMRRKGANARLETPGRFVLGHWRDLDDSYLRFSRLLSCVFQAPCDEGGGRDVGPTALARPVTVRP